MIKYRSWWWSWWLWGSLLLTHPTAPGMDKNWIAWLDFCHKVKKLVGSQPHLVHEVVTVDFNVYSSWPWQWGWWWWWWWWQYLTTSGTHAASSMESSLGTGIKWSAWTATYLKIITNIIVIILLLLITACPPHYGQLTQHCRPLPEAPSHDPQLSTGHCPARPPPGNHIYDIVHSVDSGPCFCNFSQNQTLYTSPTASRPRPWNRSLSANYPFPPCFQLSHFILVGVGSLLQGDFLTLPTNFHCQNEKRVKAIQSYFFQGCKSASRWLIKFFF